MIEPGGPGSQPRVDPVLRLRGGLAVVRGGGAGGDRPVGPCIRLGETELRPALRRPPALRVIDPGRLRQPHHPVTADAADQLDAVRTSGVLEVIEAELNGRPGAAGLLMRTVRRSGVAQTRVAEPDERVRR